MTGYTKKFKENKTMSLKVKAKQLFKNYNKIWKKIERLMSIDFESKPFYADDIYINIYIYIRVLYAGKSLVSRNTYINIFRRRVTNAS